MVDFAKALKDKSGKFDKLLAFDCETSGITYEEIDPSKNFRMVSCGLIIADIEYNPIEELYVEFKWNDPGLTEKFYWKNEAEKIHGLSQEYLNTHGVTEVEAAESIGGLLYDHFGLNHPINLLGTNVMSFDQFFFRHFLQRNGLKFKFSHRSLDTFSLAMGTVKAYTSKELFELFDLERGDTHNALMDAKYSLKAFQIMSRLWDKHVNQSI